MAKNNIWKIVKNPLIESNLTILRNKKTKRKDFCKAITDIAKLLVFAISNDWKTTSIQINTPLTKTNSLTLNEKVALIPILRAGVALLEGFQDLIPDAEIGHIGLYRDKKNFQVHEYYFKMPQLANKTQIVVLDPMIATANTVIKAIKRLQANSGDCQISLVSIITSDYAKRKIDQTLQNIKIYTVNIDPELNTKKYIIPGLGDAGDRFFGTE